LRQFDLAAFKEIPIKDQLRCSSAPSVSTFPTRPTLLSRVNDLNAGKLRRADNINFGMFPKVFQFALKMTF